MNDALVRLAERRNFPILEKGTYMVYETYRDKKWTIRWGVVEEQAEKGPIVLVKEESILSNGFHDLNFVESGDALTTNASSANECTDYSAEVASALNTVEAARLKVGSLEEAKLQEVGRYINPPISILYTFQTVFQILESSAVPTWAIMKPILRKKGFLSKVVTFNVSEVPLERCTTIINSCSRMRSVTQKGGSSSAVASVLQEWVYTVYLYLKWKYLMTSTSMKNETKPFSGQAKSIRDITKMKELGCEFILRSSIVASSKSRSELFDLINETQTFNDKRISENLLCVKNNAPQGNEDQKFTRKENAALLSHILTCMSETKRILSLNSQDQAEKTENERDESTIDSDVDELISKVHLQTTALCIAATSAQAQLLDRVQILEETAQRKEATFTQRSDHLEGELDGKGSLTPFNRSFNLDSFLLDQKHIRHSMAIQIAELDLALTETQKRLTDVSILYETMRKDFEGL